MFWSPHLPVWTGANREESKTDYVGAAGAGTGLLIGARRGEQKRCCLQLCTVGPFYLIA